MVTMRVMDSRNIPHGIEMDVEVTKDKERGFAIVKTFGPNGKKECTIMVNKSKKYDVKYVKILALDVIKLLLDKFISGEGWMNVLKKVNTAVTNKKSHHCKHCNKGFCNEKNLKIHVDKFHSIQIQSKCEECTHVLVPWKTIQKDNKKAKRS